MEMCCPLRPIIGFGGSVDLALSRTGPGGIHIAVLFFLLLSILNDRAVSSFCTLLGHAFHYLFSTLLEPS